MKYITPVAPKHATGLLAEVYDEIQAVFHGDAPSPYLVHSLHPLFLSALWDFCKSSYFSGSCTRAEKDAVACGVSLANECTFCLDAHAELLRFEDRQAATGVLRGNDQAASDPWIRSLVAWGRATLCPDEPIIQHPEFDDATLTEAIATALNFHYTNRVVNVFCGRSPFPLPAVPGVRSLLVLLGRRILRSVAETTMSYGLSPNTRTNRVRSVPWAESNPSIATTFSALALAAEQVGESTLSDNTREVVAQRLERWDGEQIPLVGGDFDDELGRLDSSERPIAKLVYLSALASQRVSVDLIAQCRDVGANDGQISGAVIWGSFQAAERIEQWLARSVASLRCHAGNSHHS